MSRATALKITVQIKMYIKNFNKYTRARIHIHVRSMMFAVSKPLTFHNGFMFLLLVDVSSTLADYKALTVQTDREEHVCNVWYMIKKENGEATRHY